MSVEKVRAKFVLHKIEQYMSPPGSARLGFLVVTNGCEENKSFAKYTPSGEISMMIDNPSAVEFFELGKPYYVDFITAT